METRLKDAAKVAFIKYFNDKTVVFNNQIRDLKQTDAAAKRLGGQQANLHSINDDCCQGPTEFT